MVLEHFVWCLFISWGNNILAKLILYLTVDLIENTIARLYL